MKTALFAFNGEPMCFVHVLLTALDMRVRGHDVVVVIEGAATRIVALYNDDPAAPFRKKYDEVVQQGLIDGVCRACAAKMGVLDAVEAQGFSLLDGVSGHPSMAAYMEDGYQIITF